MEIEVRTETKRGCGWRKKGGLYLISGGSCSPCGRLPLPLSVCPTCSCGIKPTRGTTWINPKVMFASVACSAAGDGPGEMESATSGIRLPIAGACKGCSLSPDNIPAEALLIWIGGKFYPTPDHFMQEAAERGVSRRIPALPKGFEVGKDLVLLAHRQCISVPRDQLTPEEAALLADGELFGWRAGIFTSFRPSAVEYVVKGDESDEELDRLAKRGIKPVMVINPDKGTTATDDDDDDDLEGL